MKFELNEERNGYTLVSSDDVPTVDIPREYDGKPVTRIENGAFAHCTSLTSITIPNSVMYISRGAFRDCASLTSVTIGNGVTSISSYAFYGCASLKSVYYDGDKASWDKITFGNKWANPLCYGATLHTMKVKGEKGKYERLTPTDAVELINEVFNENGDKTNLLRYVLRLKELEDERFNI